MCNAYIPLGPDSFEGFCGSQESTKGSTEGRISCITQDSPSQLAETHRTYPGTILVASVPTCDKTRFMNMGHDIARQNILGGPILIFGSPSSYGK